MLTYLAIAERLKPRWLVWENVPGVLSSNGGKDFGSFLGALGELGYEWAYRVLDAQWFGVAQRRRRVFVVAHLGKGNLASKVLFESESVRRNPAPSREAGQGIATDVEAGIGGGDKISAFRMQAFGEYSNDGTASAMKARDYKDATDLVASPVIIDRAAFNQGENAQYKPRIEHGETMDSLVARGPHAVAFQTSELRLTGKLTEQSVCPTLKANTKAGDTEVKVVLYENHPNDSRVTGPHDVAPSCVSRYGTGGGNVPLVQEAVAFEPGIAIREGNESRFVKELSPTLRKEMGDNQVAVAAFKGGQGSKAGGIGYSEHVAPTLPASDGGNRAPTLLNQMAVRRLTPRECERLQGFPDDHTLISWRGKPADQCPDGPRYKALGNSMAVPCMAWIGERIEWIENERQGAA